MGSKEVCVTVPVIIGCSLIRNPGYQTYKECTSPLLPLPPPLYKRINKWVKVIFCCEFPFYKVKMEEEPVKDEKSPITSEI